MGQFLYNIYLLYNMCIYMFLNICLFISIIFVKHYEEDTHVLTMLDSDFSAFACHRQFGLSELVFLPAS